MCFISFRSTEELCSVEGRAVEVGTDNDFYFCA